MKTAFQTGPGIFAANTRATDDTIPKGGLRVFCARIEAYDLEHDSEADLETSFTLLVAMTAKDKRLARALLRLADALNANREVLEQNA